MRTLMAIAIGVFVLFGTLAAEPTAPQKQDQQGIGEQLGEQLDRGLTKLGRQLRKGWAEVRRSVDELGVQGRVYGRLHWDKSINGAPINIDVQDNDVVVLSGSLPSEETHRLAVKLARTTVGVRDVVDHLAVAPPKPTTAPPLVPQR